jgi:RNA-directed DNA polymerase
MQGQLELPFEWEPESNEEVKLLGRVKVAEHNSAKYDDNLTNQTKKEETDESLLDSILDTFNIEQACYKVRSNKGASGIDNISVKDIESYMKEHWSRIESEIRECKYRPSPVKRVEIPKPNGGMRLLGIPTVIDRVIQQAILQKLTPIFDPEFSTSSYGFRPNRSGHDAIRKARSYMEDGFYVVVDIDLEKFFDKVNHDILMSRIARKVKDKSVLRLIRAYLNAGVLLEGVCCVTEEGVPQGGPLSPLLANIMLDDLDKELEKRGHKFCRYADDCNIYVKSFKSGERVRISVTNFLKDKLKLKVNEEKSAVDRPSNRKFLGFSFLRWGLGVKIRISPQSLDKVKDKIREITKSNWSISLEERIRILNSYLRGWMGYYALTDDPSILDNISSWIRRRLRMVVWNQWKKPIARYRNLRKLKLSDSEARKVAYNSSGAWSNAYSRSVHTAMNNKFWTKCGLLNLSQLHREIRKNW